MPSKAHSWASSLVVGEDNTPTDPEMREQVYQSPSRSAGLQLYELKINNCSKSEDGLLHSNSKPIITFAFFLHLCIPLEYKSHVCLLLLCAQLLEQSLAHSRCSNDFCWEDALPSSCTDDSAADMSLPYMRCPTRNTFCCTVQSSHVESILWPWQSSLPLSHLIQPMTRQVPLMMV